MNMKMCACGNRAIPTDLEMCQDCAKAKGLTSPFVPVVVWSVIAFVVAVVVGVVLQS